MQLVTNLEYCLRSAYKVYVTT